MECGEEDELQRCIVEELLINCHSPNNDIRKGTFSKDGYIEWEDGTHWINEGIENEYSFSTNPILPNVIVMLVDMLDYSRHEVF